MRKYTVILLILIVPLLFSDCHKPSISSPITAAPYARFEHWISWNLSFTPVSAPDSIPVITALENYVRNWAISKDPTSLLTFRLLHCPCDTLLTNLDATLVTGSGKPVAPPPNQPNPGPSGDYLVGTNFDLNIPSYLDTVYLDLPNLTPDTTAITYIPGSDSMNKTLAVIDTGLDSVLFQKAYPKSVWAGNLLWQDNAETIFDVVPGEPTNLLKDGGIVEHGTAATAIFLRQMAGMRPNRIPKIMSIRAFDDSEKGSIYTVSCALSYAIQHKAGFVNASWGYYGKLDSVLLKYIRRADSAHIRMIASAGNTPGTHDPTKICAPAVNAVNNLDQLATTDHLFYPACLAPVIPNLVSVTQLHSVPASTGPQSFIPCFFQNYSPNYITVGAFQQNSNNTNCCSFKPPYLAGSIEGSSFATPVITAKLMFELEGSSQDIKSFILSNSQVAPPISGTTSIFYTNQGRFIPF